MSQSNPEYLPDSPVIAEMGTNYPPVTEQLVASYSFDALSLPADPLIPHPAVSQRVSAQPLLVFAGCRGRTYLSGTFYFFGRIHNHHYWGGICRLVADGDRGNCDGVARSLGAKTVVVTSNRIPLGGRDRLRMCVGA